MKVTSFQETVYETCRRIPAGRVCTYAGVARAIDCGSPRAVGQALRRNPFAPEVPCHRVVKTDRTLGGFTGHRAGPEVDRKKRLLEAEGVKFDDQGRVRSECMCVL